MAEKNNWQGAVEQIRRAATTKGRKQLGCYSIEGIRLHERALNADVEIVLCTIAKDLLKGDSERIQILHTQLHELKCPIFAVPAATMATLTNGRSLGGIISLVKTPAIPNLESLVTAVSNPTLLIAQDIVDPGNIGAMMRTAHANGVVAFINSGDNDPYHPKAVRTSMGSIFKMPVLQRPSLDKLLVELADLHIETVGTVASDGVLLPNVTFSKRGTAVFMGSEYFGLPKEMLPKLDTLVTIPMRAGIDSMSVNAATAVTLYEIQRQKTSYK